MEVRGQFSGVISFFHHVGPKTKIQITRLSSNYLSLLNLYFLPHFFVLFLRPGPPHSLGMYHLIRLVLILYY